MKLYDKFSVEILVDAIEIGNGVVVYQSKTFKYDSVGSEKSVEFEYGYSRKDKLKIVDCTLEHNIWNGFLVAKKEFLEEYKRIAFPMEEWADTIRRNMIEAKSLYKIVSSDKNAISDYVLLFYRTFNETIYFYPEADQDLCVEAQIANLNKNHWIPHLCRFGSTVYNIVDSQYDLNNVLKYLNSRKDVVITSEGIESIPYYNEFAGKRFINFMFLANSYEESKNHEIFKEIEKFKRRGYEYL